MVAGVPSLFAQPALTVEKIEIRHIGPPAASDDLIRANIHFKVGDAYKAGGFNDDIRNLYNTGYFHNIQVSEVVHDDKVTLVYVVQGKPILTEIRFAGNTKFSDKKLRAKVTSKVGKPLDEPRLFQDAQEIQKLYQKSGYQKTEVKYLPPVIKENLGQGTVTFQITESPKVRIVNVQFVGAKAFTQKKLRKTIKTRRHWMFSWLTGSGVLKDEQFDEDKEKLAEFYHNEGYIDFELKDVKFDYSDGRHMIIRFIINEGTQYKVGAIEFKGNALFQATNIVQSLFKKELPMKVGDSFTPNGLTKDIDAIQDFYGAKGYIDTRVSAIKSPNTERGTMDLVFALEEGEKSYIERIEIKGNVKTKDKVIRRELSVAPGEVFNMVQVKLSTNRVAQLAYFSKVDAEAEPTVVPNRKDLVIAVEEDSTGHFDLGAGFSSIEQLFGFVTVTQGNFDLFNPPYFTGGGEKLRLNAQVGTQLQDYQLTFTEPWFMNRKLALDVNLYYRDLDYYSTLYNVKEAGVRIGLTRPLFGSDFIKAGINYTIEDTGIHFKNGSDQPQRLVTQDLGRGDTVTLVPPAASPLLLSQAGDKLVSKVGLTLSYDTRNSVFLPNRGQYTDLLTEVAGGPLGADVNFYRFEMGTAWYFKGPFKDHVLEVAARAGTVVPYGGTTDIPLFYRYFLGGANTLEAYKYHDVGPRDVTGEPIGGNTYDFAVAEYSIPIIERLRFALFYEIGNVYSKAYDFNVTDYTDNWGVGIRLNIPRLGPLRLDYGLPLRHDPALGNSGRFQFTVGYHHEL